MYYSVGFAHPLTLAATPEELEGSKAMVRNFQIGYPNWDGRPLTPERSVSMVLDVIKALNIEDTGAFVSHKGNKEWL